MKTTLGRRWLSLLLTLVLCLGLSQAVWAEDPPAGTPDPKITLSRTALDLTEGGSETLTATVEENGTEVPNAKVDWRSSDEAIATVNNGTVTAVAAAPPPSRRPIPILFPTRPRTLRAPETAVGPAAGPEAEARVPAHRRIRRKQFLRPVRLRSTLRHPR